jgi:hypothetical protein
MSAYDYWHITQNQFNQFKDEYTIYGTHTELDTYGNEYTARDSQPRAVVRTMWHPLEDRVDIAEYGRDFDKILYAILYDAPAGLSYGDRVEIKGETYEVTAIRQYNTHTRVDVKRLAGDAA